MGSPGDSPRRQPYGRPGAPQPHGRPDVPRSPSAPEDGGENWFAPAPSGQSSPSHGHTSPPYGQAPSHDQAPPYGQAPPRRQVPSHAQAPPRGQAPPYGPASPPPDRTAPSVARDEPTAPRKPAERPRQEMWSPYDEGPRSRRPIIIASAGLAVLVAAGIGLAVLAGSDDGAVPAATESASPSKTVAVPPAAPGDEFGFAASRATDPHALTAKELFGSKSVKVKGQTYTRTVWREDKAKKCKDAVVGAKLQKALASGKCTQLIRASFRDSSGKIIGTVGVANLGTSASAARVVKAVSGKKLEEYLKVLPGKDKVTKFLGTGEAFAGGWRHGHYAILVWFQYKDGHAPSKNEAKKLNAAAFGVADATVTPALESRSLTGRRP
ncbi:hypothetical protein [Planobispora rosea]|nr:hypothetical protein [Planobispora rosea]